MIAIVLVGGAITILFGERIGIFHGLGWDGQAYAAWAKDFPHEVLDAGVNTYQSQRVLPSGLLYYAMALVGAAHTDANVIVAFQLLDLASLAICALLLGLIAKQLAWTRAQLWVAFVATFLGFANAKEALYYPTLTDSAAFALAMATVWAYLARRALAQWLILFASAFTWPALFAFGALASILPRPAAPLPRTTGAWHRHVAIGFAIATAAFIVVWFLYVLAHPVGIERWLDRAHHELYPLTIGCIAVATALAAYFVARQDETWSVWPYLRGVRWRRIVIGVAVVVAIVVARELWERRAGTKGYGFGWRELRHYYVANAMLAPLWNVVHQVVYYGPIVLVVIAAWPQIAACAARWGPTAVLALGFAVMSSVSSDARHLLHAMPFVIVIAVTATAAWWTPRRVLGFALIYLPWSKLWLAIRYTAVHDSLAWPDLRFFMQHGPWASDATFLAHLAGVVITSVALWLLLRR